MSTFNVPTREEVSEKNQGIFDNLEKALGFVPNLYATYANSDTALENYLNFANAKTSLSAKEKEVVNLAVSQVNKCIYCLSAQTAIGKMNGFTDEQILELRAGKASFDT
ncbi:carboxymuconolactone decarboxylase family protein, partial [Maribacter dokdonensis]|uniref:carboxymuconolactone decarboxylase family protein n=1 Tax=Maribacter dokdonensis TaxID=320912 RepID=UPI00329A0067